MDSMYDRLGDLLSSALETGKIPGKDSGEPAGNADQVPPEPPPDKTGGTPPQPEKKHVYHLKAGQIRPAQKETGRGEVIHAAQIHSLPEQIVRAFEMLGTAPGASQEEIKKAYHEKLKRFHPDSNSSNDTVQKVARQKTSEIIEAFTRISDWTSRQH